MALASLHSARLVAQMPSASCVIVQQRNMATLQEIKMRLVSVTNIQKITKSMKMVSAAKFARAERALRAGKAFGEGAQAIIKSNNVKIPDGYKGRYLFAASSDRGLCGGIHSYVSKQLRPIITVDKEAKLVVYGDKVRSQMQRFAPENIQVVFADVGKRPPVFGDASRVAQESLSYDWDLGTVVFNKFLSAIAYDTQTTTVVSAKGAGSLEELGKYEVEGDALQSYAEFQLAATVYGALIEGAASEQSARMQAMENATKNAGEMIDKLRLLYNRQRQAVITNELIEIISGASAV